MPAWIDEFPKLRDEWASSNDLSPEQVTRGSNKVVTWNCDQEHVWDAPVKSRTGMNSGCPYCSGRRAVTGVTDLETLFPSVARFWSYLNPMPPSQVTSKSHRKVWWQCPDGHDWQRAVATQVTIGAKCPECSMKSATVQHDSVAAVAPNLVPDWSPANRLPADRHAVNGARVKWECHICKHEWTSRVIDRVNGSPCPSCSGRILVKGVNDLATKYPWTAAQWSVTNTIKHDEVRLTSTERVKWNCAAGHTYTMSVKYRLIHGEDYCPMCWDDDRCHAAAAAAKARRDSAKAHHRAKVTTKTVCASGHVFDEPVPMSTSCGVCSGKVIVAGVNDITTTHPDVAARWHPDNDRAANTVSARSTYRAKWNTSCGHVVSAPVRDRVVIPDNCAVCSGKQVQVGVNDLSTTHPAVAKEWHSRNRLRPTEVTAGSGMRVWWDGKCGHEWEARVTYRTGKGAGCPLCSRNRIVAGVNDLATTHPEVAAQWSSRNSFSSTSVSSGSNKRVWWECGRGHVWDTTPLSRTQDGTGCPMCANRVVVAGFNDLATTHPLIAKEWHPTRNGSMLPSKITYGSRRKMWWRGTCTHEWESPVLNRVNGSGCPRCAHRVSAAEAEVRRFVESVLPLGTEVLGSDRKALGERLELDVYVPSLRLGIEFNGVYWHSTAAGKSKTYHRDKVVAGEAKGVRIVQVWEDDWRDKRDVVEDMLRVRLGVDNRPKLSARTLTHRAVTYAEAKEFLERTHVQGSVRGGAYDALIDANGVVQAIMVTTVRGKEYRLERYATSTSVRGGFGKLLKVLETRVHAAGGGDIVTFADREISNGDLYRAAGFTDDGELEPDYSYLVGGTRRHKFGYRKARFKRDPDLLYSDGLTEEELATLNGFPRIYDSGKLRFRKTILP